MNTSGRRTLEFVVPRICVALPKAGDADVSLSREASLVDRHLVGDLHVLYAFDMDSHYVLVAQRDLTRIGVSDEELHERAMWNLRALKVEVRAHKRDRIFMLTAGGNYEATLLLLPEVWESVSSMVSGRIVAAVPARDVLYITGDADIEDLACLRRWTSQAIEKVDKPLSRIFIRWTGTEWEKFEGYAG
jgi:uncharacterized protein YtpQ (UPF0354 family)